ncbi:ribonuclease H-like domain-containing protein [Tanacetum coccineum]
MSANDKFGLGYGDHRFDGILSYENEVLQSVFMNNDSNTDDRTLYDRFITTDGMHAVPPLITENYIPSGPDIEIDESQFTYGPKQTQPSESESQISEFDTCDSNINTKPSELVSEPVVNESNVECQPKQVKTPRETVKNQFTHSQKPKVDKKELGYGFTVRACFVCGSLNHLIRDCDFHEKRMARKAELNNGWNNVQRVNKQNQFVPSAVLTRTGKIPVSTARASGTKNVSTARQSFNRQTVLTSTAMKINTVKPIVNRVRPANVFHKTHSPYSRPFKKTTVLSTNFSKQKFNNAKVNVVSAVGGKRETAIKSSAGCNWIPQRYNWHNVSKYNGGSILRNCYTFKDLLGRLKPNRLVNVPAPDWGTRPTLLNFKTLMVALLLLEVVKVTSLVKAEAVSTACYVLNRVLVTKPHNKTPYELLTGKQPIISYIRPFGCHVTILNTIDHLGKFAGKSDEGFLVGYSLQSKAFRVYNLETKRVEENLHITFLENKPNVAGKGPTWLFDLDYIDLYARVHKSEIVSLECMGETEVATPDYNVQMKREKDLQRPELKIHIPLADFTNMETVVNVASPIPPHINAILISFLVLFARSINNQQSLMSTKKYNSRMKKAIGTKWVYRNKKDGLNERELLSEIKQGLKHIRIFLAFASYMGFIALIQIDVRKCFIMEKMDEELLEPEKDKHVSCGVQVYVDDIIFGLQRNHWCDEFEALRRVDFMRFNRRAHFFLGFTSKRKKMVSLLDSDLCRVNLDKKSTTRGCSISWAGGTHFWQLQKEETIVATLLQSRIMYAAVRVVNHVYHSQKQKQIAIGTLIEMLMRRNYQGGLIGFKESLSRVIDGTEALLIPTLFNLWLDTVIRQCKVTLISLLTTITLTTTMVVLDSCPKHNMVSYLEKSEGNAEFHEIIDFLTRSSIHHALAVSLVCFTPFVLKQFGTSAKVR